MAGFLEASASMMANLGGARSAVWWGTEPLAELVGNLNAEAARFNDSIRLVTNDFAERLVRAAEAYEQTDRGAIPAGETSATPKNAL